MSNFSKILIAAFPIDKFKHDDVNYGQLVMQWLGQAGFGVFYKDSYLMVDPYLSDYLAKKYAGKEFPHKRMMPVPIDMAKVKGLNYVLCTHRHSDHMDPETLPILLKNNSKCKLVAPRAEKKYVIETLGINEDKVIFVNANESVILNDHIQIEVVPSAHEELKTDSEGNHHYLGYILKLGDITLYHSGDCVPYDSLAKELKNKEIDVALLPVNGRDEFRTSRGVLGNFSFEESVGLCKSLGISKMICHHFGMFDFNTMDINILINKVNQNTDDCFKCIIPNTNDIYIIN